MIEKNAANDKKSISLPVELTQMMPVKFRASVRTHGSEVRVGVSEHFGRSSKVELGSRRKIPNRFEEIKRPVDNSRLGVERLVEPALDVGLRREVVDLIRLNVMNQFCKAHSVRDVPLIKMETINWLNAAGIERRAAANNSMDLVSFLKQKIGHIAARLAADSCDQRFHLKNPLTASTI